MFDLIFGSSTQKTISQAITIIAALVAVYLFLYFFSNFKPVQSLFYGIAFIALIASAVVSVGNLNIYYSAKGGVIGEITSIFKKNQIELTEEEKEIVFDCKNIVLMKNSKGKYSASMTTDVILPLENNELYFISVNNEPCSTISCENKDIYAIYNYSFMDRVDGKYQILAEDAMTIYFALYDNYSYLYLEVENGDESVQLWNSYFNKNGFKVKISKTTTSYYTAANYKQVRFFSKDYKEIKTITLKENTDYILPQLEYDGFTYKYWRKSNNELVSKITSISENYDFYGLDYVPVDLSETSYNFTIDDLWYTESASNIPNKTYNCDFAFENTILSSYLENKNFSKIEINISVSTYTQPISGEYAIDTDIGYSRSSSLVLTLLSDGTLYCESKLYSMFYLDNQIKTLEVDNNLNLNSGYSLENGVLKIDSEYTAVNYQQSYQEKYLNDKISSKIFVGLSELRSLDVIKIYE